MPCSALEALHLRTSLSMLSLLYTRTLVLFPAACQSIADVAASTGVTNALISAAQA